MRGSLLSAIVLGSLAAQAAGKRPRGSACRSLVTVTEIFTVTSLPEGPATPSSATPTSALTSLAQSSSASSNKLDKPTSTTVIDQISSSSSPSSSSSSSSPSSVASSQVPASSSASTNPSPSQTSSSPYADATEINVDVSATEQCGTNDRLRFGTGIPWTLSNNMYNAKRMVGKQCTNFVRVLGTADGARLVEWTSTTDIDKVDGTADVCKGYSNFGDGPGQKKRLREIKSIPAYFEWSRTIDGEFKGGHVFDLMISPDLNGGEKPGTTELMLYLKTWGGQRPMGWGDGAVDTVTLYGRAFTLYHAVHPTHGQDVYTLEPELPFEGVFEGDIKAWIDLMADRGLVQPDEYLNNWTGGVEVFYGRSTLEATSNMSLVV